MAGSSRLGWGGGAEQAWGWGLQPGISEAPWVPRRVLPSVPGGGGAAPQEGSRKLQLLPPALVFPSAHSLPSWYQETGEQRRGGREGAQAARGGDRGLGTRVIHLQGGMGWD